MRDARKILEQMRREPASVRFADLRKVCVAYFGEPRQSGTSHAVFRMPWSGDPRVNISQTRVKPRHRQVLAAIEKLEGIRHER